MSEIRELGFRLNDGIGQMLLDLARDTFYDSLDLDKALSIYVETLGCSKDIALEIFKGEKIVENANEGMNVNVRPKREGDEVNIINFEEFLTLEFLEIKEECKGYSDFTFENLRKMIRKFTYITVEPDYKELSNLLESQKKLDLNEFYDPDDFDELQRLYNSVKIEVLNVVDRYLKLEVLYSLFKNDFSEHLQSYGNVHYNYVNAQYFVELMQTRFNRVVLAGSLYEDDTLTKHIEANRVIDGISKITPVSILDNWNAGWLAPNGDYYGLNGEISNMLHMTIAEMLKDAGVIKPEKDLEGHSIETYLSNSGWVKIHGNWILYDGYALADYDYDEVPLTDIQIQYISRYGQSCHKGVLKVGYTQELISAARFEMTPEDKLKDLFKI